MSEVNEIFGRLFDHRPFLQSEINNFKKEFEEKRGDREVEQLFKALEHITEIKEVRFEKVVECCDAHLPRTTADLQVALRMCQDTAVLKQRFEEQGQEVLSKRRADRVTRLSSSMTEHQVKLRDLKISTEEKEKELRDSYA